MGDFSVKTAYFSTFTSKIKYPVTSSSHSTCHRVWSGIWRIKAPPKIINFLWRAVTGSLPTAYNLFQRKCEKSPLCGIFGLGAETVEHCLLTCSWASAIWFGSNIGIRIVPSNITTLDCWLLDLFSIKLSDPNAEELLSCICCLLYLGNLEKQVCFLIRREEAMFSVLYHKSKKHY